MLGIHEKEMLNSGLCLQVRPLPTPLWGMRGASLAGVFHITGGWMAAADGHWINTDEILAWNERRWQVAGSMTNPRDWQAAHGVTETDDIPPD